MWFVSPAEIEGRGADRGRPRRHLHAALRARSTRRAWREGSPTACEARGVVDLRALPGERARAGPRRLRGRERCARAIVVRATEAYTTRLPGERRRYLPLASHMLATEPLPPETWARDRLGRLRADRRPALPVRLHPAHARRPDRDRRTRARLQPRRRDPRARRGAAADPRGGIEQTLRRSSRPRPPCAITHRWGGFFAAPRDWCMSVTFDRATGIARAGGYSGHGLVASSLAGRTLADLITGTDERARPTCPGSATRAAAGSRSRCGCSARGRSRRSLASADAAEDRTGRRRAGRGSCDGGCPGR